MASSGRSAETAACARLWLMETAHVAGFYGAANLFDQEKFYDTVQPNDVRRNAVQRSYPRTELQLALSMHKAPRILQMIGIASAILIPTRSIIQGCKHSNLFARLVIWRPAQRAEQDVSDIRTVNKTMPQVQTRDWMMQGELARSML